MSAEHAKAVTEEETCISGGENVFPGEVGRAFVVPHSGTWQAGLETLRAQARLPHSGVESSPLVVVALR
jgi:hypothetical protein